MIDASHQPWRVERSFRTSEHDLHVRSIYHHKRASIDTDLTVVFAALAVPRYIEAARGVDIRNRTYRLGPR